MMNEKRFRLIKIDDYVFQIKDIDNDLYLVAEQICNLLNEQQARIEMLEKGILDCLFNNKSIGILAEEMELVE